ncbi:hypothetical protein SKAU_G00196680 [Synaphobranchus kaupii]|uniref:Uncharacterized protein n=1 Tax=Synaphobranchus kaupii TaxID=118154 RepID=A0A9Q1IWW3_SYNKA|nr:hypothetical protein SKAU_G00196680 [Synaphobranchus kaupii]
MRRRETAILDDSSSERLGLNMLILWLLLGIHLPSMGVKADYCIKALPCVATQCFEIRGSEDAVCNSTHHKEVCCIEGTRIKLKCDTQLSCKCKELDAFPLAGRVGYPAEDQSKVINVAQLYIVAGISMKNELRPEDVMGHEGEPTTPEVPKWNTTPRIYPSGSSNTRLRIGVAISITILCTIIGATIWRIVWRRRASQRSAIRMNDMEGNPPSRSPTEEGPCLLQPPWQP